MGSSELDNVNWKGNSQKMFKIILEAVPPMFKSTVKHEVEAWISKNNVSEVTEELVLQAFKEKAPKPMWNKLFPQLDAMKTE
ncbi:hypothetical protein LY28_02217 [Ruminiclostridium sufflavum DSM 19573]|uniref:Uncharacterized protein n=2 Tax=Ruminiclostridium TaxID=1508657 RepID=A0A318XWX8_9FIRM|nr:hypothetical protein LY28_02217 [Ruminiclostridium sufflavum DSM 19573]